MTQPNLAERLLGPAITILITLIYHWFVALGFAPVTTAVLFPFVVLAAFISGLRAGLVAALWVSGYSAWLLWGSDPQRVLVVAASLIMTNIMVGWLKRQTRVADETRRKAEAVDELNGNIIKLHEASLALNTLLDNWKAISDEAKLSETRFINHKVAELLTVVQGWRELWREKESMVRMHEKWLQTR